MIVPKPSNEMVRYLALSHYDQGLTNSQSYKAIIEIYGPKSVARSTVRKWHFRFANGERGVADRPRSGRMRRVPDSVILSTVERATDTKLKYLSTELNLSKSLLSKRLKQLKIVRKKSTIVPYDLNQMTRLDREIFAEALFLFNLESNIVTNIITVDETWIYFDNRTRKYHWVPKGSHPPAQSMPNLHQRKLMVTIWYDRRGIIHYKFKTVSEKINEIYYTEAIIEMHKVLKDKRPEYFEDPSDPNNNEKVECVYYHQDNARPHTALGVRHILESLRLELLPHPPYSPDLAPCDYHLFRALKHFMRNDQIRSYDQARGRVEEFLGTLDSAFFTRGFDQWAERWRYVRDNRGAYATVF